MGNLNAIDLFSGCGGLSLGLKDAGFDVLLGLEINKEISKTYIKNHPESEIITEDIRKITGNDIRKMTRNKHIHLIAGCPPCQGFSQLTEKYKKEDPRNQLPLEMIRVVEEIKPDMVMVENVPGIMKKGKSILDQFVKRLEDIGYIVNYNVLQVADYGIPQSRRRFVLLAGRGFEIKLPEPTHSKKKEKGKKRWITLREALKKVKNKPMTLLESKNIGGPQKYNWHIVRDLTPITMQRLMSVTSGGSRTDIPERLRPLCHKGKAKGFGNVYGRLNWDEISPTITRGCTTLSMGRFGHPTENRTISIREAAIIQTFPINYKFDTERMDIAALMVGNALPVKFAKITAKACTEAFYAKKNN